MERPPIPFEQAVTAPADAVPAPEPVAASQSVPQSLFDYPATYALLAVNLAVFVVMLGVGTGPLPVVLRHHLWSHLLTAPFDEGTLIRFGAVDSSLVLQGQWWRLLTSMFVHVTVLHIALNLWCLWNLGLFGEPLLGRQGLVWVYILTGWAGMLLTLLWAVFRHAAIETAGASGAVFGIAGILIVLLSNRKLSLPWNELRDLRRQVIFFAVANLALGLGPGLLSRFSADMPRIDNSAHLGGFVCGLALGLPLFPRMTSGRSSYRARQRWTFSVAALLLLLVGYAIRVGTHG